MKLASLTETTLKPPRRAWAPGLLAGVWLLTTPAHGQAEPAGATPPPANGATVTAADADPTIHVLDELRPTPSGLTSDVAGRRAAATSFAVAQQNEALEAAAAKVDQSFQAFLPKLRTSAGMYLVDITNPPSLGTVVIDTAGPGPATAAQLAAGNLKAISLALPTTLGSYLLQATISVPISDYFLRLGDSYAAATDARDAARYDLASARSASSASARVAFYTWLRALGAVVVSREALNDQKTHLGLARSQYDAGRASKIDVLRAETDVASAELALEQAKNLSELSQKQVRIAIHARDEETLHPGESLDGTMPPVGGSLRALEDEALGKRADIKSLTATAAAAREQARATRNAAYPSLSASGNAIAANNDSGSLGPTSNWIGVFYVGANLTWSPNESWTQATAGSEASHRAAALDAQLAQLKDSIEVEVTQDWQNVRLADFSIGTAERELASAEEGYRVAKELWTNGRATSSDLTDAETDLTRARLDLLNARVNARVSRVQLAHALGRDLTAP
jgi:outer membrane protein TolC